MEVQCQLLIAERLSYISFETSNPIIESVASIARQLNALRDAQLDRTEEPEVEYESSSPYHLMPLSPLETINHLNHSPMNPTPYFVHETAIVDEGAQIGDNTKIWHFCHVMPKAIIGKDCSLGQNVFVANGVTLGNNVKVQNNVSIYEGVNCEDDTFLGPSMVFTNVYNPRSAVNRKNEYMKTTVGRGASIGANATIVCGNDIGPFAFIGAGSVVTKEVPAYALMVGNPARQIGWMSEHGERLHFDENGEAVCPGSGEVYRLSEDRVEKLRSLEV